MVYLSKIGIGVEGEDEKNGGVGRIITLLVDGANEEVTIDIGKGHVSVLKVGMKAQMLEALKELLP